MARYGEDYDILRWAARNPNNPEDYIRDDSGRIIWHKGLPSNNEVPTVGVFTADFNPNGNFRVPRNLVIHPDEPLHIPGEGYSFDDVVQYAIDNDTPPAASYQ